MAIIFGGMSAEYSVSLQSAHAVITHLDTSRFVPVLVGITREGRWYRFRGAPDHLLDDSWREAAYCTPAYLPPCRGEAGLLEYGGGVRVLTRLDAAFPVMHGPYGEDGKLQGLLEMAGIPVVGCGSLAGALCMDKDLAHRLVKAAGIAVPRSRCFGPGAPFAEIAAAAAELGYPLFAKPVNAGSSFGISRVSAPEELEAAVREAYRYDGRLLLEEAIEGCELGCAVLGGGDTLLTGEPDEIELAGGFFCFEEKYNLHSAKIHVPARLSAEATARVKETATAIYRLLGCGGFARVDMFLRPGGELVFNEVNTIPGFTAHSRYPAMMAAAGLPFPALVTSLIDAAVAS